MNPWTLFYIVDCYLSSAIRGLRMSHRPTDVPQTFVQKLWLIDLVKLGYSFKIHA